MKSDIPRIKAEFFKTLGHPLRIRSLELLRDGERSVGELLDLTGAEQSQLSQQLGVLRRAELVTKRREGALAFYSLTDERIEDLLEISRAMLLDRATASQAGLASQ